jgi:hypothetical protein
MTSLKIKLEYDSIGAKDSARKEEEMRNNGCAWGGERCRILGGRA